MPDWDEDSPEILVNIGRVQRRIEEEAIQRVTLTLKLIKSWHVDAMRGLTADKPEYIGGKHAATAALFIQMIADACGAGR